MKTKKITRYDAWFLKIPAHSNRGSFMTFLFEAYSRADMENRLKLNMAFPEEFVQSKVEVANPQTEDL